MIYLDNAATGGFKPYSVKQAYQSALENLCANAGRSGHKLSILGEEFIYKTRKAVKELFNSTSLERVVFTKNCTEALNIAILGTVKKGGHVITTVTEHNSVLRPLYKLQKQGVITIDVATPSNGRYITASDVELLIKDNTYLIIVNGASNVTGAVNDYKSIFEIAKKHGIITMLDGAQLAGHKKIDMIEDKVDILCVAGHKGLYGIMGSGVIIFNDNVEILPTFVGGTGTETFDAEVSAYPEKLECGTQNLPAICALYEGVTLVRERLNNFEYFLNNATAYLIEKLSSLNKVKIYSTENPCGIVSFEIENISSITATEILSNEFDIAVRGGFHCAPLMHEFLGSNENGLIRVSISPYNTKTELNKLYFAVKEVCKRANL